MREKDLTVELKSNDKAVKLILKKSYDDLKRSELGFSKKIPTKKVIAFP